MENNAPADEMPSTLPQPPPPVVEDPTHQIEFIRLDPEVRLPECINHKNSQFSLRSWNEIVLEPQQRMLCPTGVTVKFSSNLVATIMPSPKCFFHHGVTVVSTTFSSEEPVFDQIMVFLYNVTDEIQTIEPFSPVATLKFDGIPTDITVSYKDQFDEKKEQQQEEKKKFYTLRESTEKQNKTD